MNKFEQVSSDDYQMSLAGGWVCSDGVGISGRGWVCLERVSVSREGYVWGGGGGGVWCVTFFCNINLKY